MSRWLWRAAGAAALLLILDVLLSVFEFAPNHVRLALLVALGVAVSGLLLDSEIAPVCLVDDNGMVTVHDRAAISHSL